MDSNASSPTSLLGTTWVANPDKHDVNKVTIHFNTASTCTTMVGNQYGPVCNWTESWVDQLHNFGMTGGSIHLTGTCSVSGGTGTATGTVAGAPPEIWHLQKQ